MNNKDFERNTIPIDGTSIIRLRPSEQQIREDERNKILGWLSRLIKQSERMVAEYDHNKDVKIVYEAITGAYRGVANIIRSNEE